MSMPQGRDSRCGPLAPMFTMVGLLIVWLCVGIRLADTQLNDKLSSPDIDLKTGNIHDNQILIRTLVSNIHRRSSNRHTSGSHPAGRDNNDDITPLLAAITARAAPKIDRARAVHHHRHKRSTTPLAGTSMFSTEDSNVGHQGGTTSSIFAPPPPPSAPMISAPASTTFPRDDGQTTPITEYATVNYNGLIGINGTDPYAITTESRTMGLPTAIQILMCLFYGTLAFTAITSNMIVCYTVLSNQRMRTATNYFIVNLAVGDILMALLCIPFTFPANLIFQFWPFGLSLCVIVSYSQANSVFISAYTMVAISIDKYIAIMHPMRLRMPKNQAKAIILVIWSAALLTSLPTALLSSLAPASADSSSSQATSTIEVRESQSTHPANFYPTEATIGTHKRQPNHSPKLEEILSRRTQETHREIFDARQKPLRDQPSGNSSESETSTRTTMSPLPSSSPLAGQFQEAQQEQYDDQKKYFCQESWTFWPRGKYYYSMALMVLQFAVPLFVLIVTYTRIVVVVWGKRIPGEEDNARDARMARSKRKMIKMVIFCVIAFALTWSPFNALIMIGDVAPEIWENQNIMYIWFITHYLAMCHTITNPLIYIWMNNRFRAGFKQVIGDVCRFIHRVFAYLFCYCLCLGCCLDCSKQKYARVTLEIERKQSRRGQLANSGSVNPYGNNGTNVQHTSTQPGSGFTGYAGLNSTMTNPFYAGAANSSNHSNNNTLKPRTSGFPANLGNGSGAVEVGRLEEHTQFLEGPAAEQALSCEPSLDLVSSTTGGRRQTRRRYVEGQKQFIKLDTLKAPTTSCVEEGSQADELLGGSGNPAGTSQSAIKLPSVQRCAGLFQRKKRRQVVRNDRKPTLDGEQARRMGRTSANAPSACGAGTVAGAKRRRRRRQTHAVCLQMTTSQFYAIPSKPASHQLAEQSVSSEAGRAAASSARKQLPIHSFDCSRRERKRHIDYLHDDRPGCHQEHASPSCVVPMAASTQPSASPPKESGSARCGHLLVDARMSSQSTATISAQTNNTSLAISPISSTKANGVGSALAGNSASVGDSNSTSASLSASAFAGEQYKDGEALDANPRESSSHIRDLDDGVTAACATDDDTDDSSIDGRDLSGFDCVMFSSKVSALQTANGETVIKSSLSNGCGSNNLESPVNDVGAKHYRSCSERVPSGSLQSSVHASETSDDVDNNGSCPINLSINGLEFPVDEYPALRPGKKIPGRALDQSSYSAALNGHRNRVGALGACNQSATDWVVTLKSELGAVGRQRQKRHMEGCRTANHHSDVASGSQQCVPMAHQELRLDRRQTASAFEVDQLSCNSRPNHDASRKAGAETARSNMRTSGQLAYDRIPGSGAHYARNGLEQMKSGSALELMHDYLPDGEHV